MPPSPPADPIEAPSVHQNRPWLLAMAAFAAAEMLWWVAAWSNGIAPLPRLGTCLLFTAAALAVAILVRRISGADTSRANRMSVALALALTAIAASLFLPLKYAIPREVPFWLDAPLMLAERSLFGTDPWRILDHAMGWAAVPMDWLYAGWLPVQSVVLFVVILAGPSPAKSRALIAYSAAWFLLGVAAAAIFASAGPLFYDRLFGGAEFAMLAPTLRSRGVWIAIAESDGMWTSFATRHPGDVAGISAVPSLHVAISLWIWLTARTLAPRTAAIAGVYFALIWIGSVQLGWHYVADGVAGAAGMLVIWWATARLPMRRNATARPSNICRTSRPSA